MRFRNFLLPRATHSTGQYKKTHTQRLLKLIPIDRSKSKQPHSCHHRFTLLPHIEQVSTRKLTHIHTPRSTLYCYTPAQRSTMILTACSYPASFPGSLEGEGQEGKYMYTVCTYVKLQYLHPYKFFWIDL